MVTCISEPIKLCSLPVLDFKHHLSFIFINIFINLTALIKLQVNVLSPKYKRIYAGQNELNMKYPRMIFTARGGEQNFKKKN